MSLSSRLPRTLGRLAVVAFVLFGLSRVGSACDSCRAALDNQGGGLAAGFNYSIYFMLSVIGLLLGGFGLLMRSSYHGAGARYRPEGKLRWSSEDEEA